MNEGMERDSALSIYSAAVLKLMGLYTFETRFLSVGFAILSAGVIMKSL